MEIRAVEFTTRNLGNAPILPETLDQISPGQEISCVTADGAYDTRKCHDMIAARGAAAITPPRRNAGPGKIGQGKTDPPDVTARNETLRETKYLGPGAVATAEW